MLFCDDVWYESEDPNWLDVAWERVGDTPVLLHPVDAAEPSLCTFPVVRAEHVRRFGSLLPGCFNAANQGGDPFLHELYRRAGAVHVLHVRVHNDIGGAVRPGLASPPPRYDRVDAHSAPVDAALDKWAAV